MSGSSGDGWSDPEILESTTLRISIDGEELDLATLEERGLVERTAARLGMSPDELRAQLAGPHPGRPPSPGRPGENAPRLPARRVDCPGCDREVVDRTGACVYCGAALE